MTASIGPRIAEAAPPSALPQAARAQEAAPAHEAKRAKAAVPKQLLSLNELLKGPDGSKPIFLIDGRRTTEEALDQLLLSKVERIEKLPPGNAEAKLFYGADNGTYVINVIMRK